MTSLRRLATAAVLFSVLAPAVAQASSGDAVIKDCTDDGKLEKTYTQKQYADALKNIPTDVDEYTDCRDVISRARLNSASSSSSSGSKSGSSGGGSSSSGGGGGGSSAGGSGGGDAASASTADTASAQAALQAATPAEQAAVAAAQTSGANAPVRVGNESISANDLGNTDLHSLSAIPTPLLIVLILLALASVSGAGGAIFSRVRRRAT